MALLRNILLLLLMMTATTLFVGCAEEGSSSKPKAEEPEEESDDGDRTTTSGNNGNAQASGDVVALGTETPYDGVYDVTMNIKLVGLPANTGVTLPGTLDVDNGQLLFSLGSPPIPVETNFQLLDSGQVTGSAVGEFQGQTVEVTLGTARINTDGSLSGDFTAKMGSQNLEGNLTGTKQAEPPPPTPEQAAEIQKAEAFDISGHYKISFSQTGLIRLKGCLKVDGQLATATVAPDYQEMSVIGKIDQKNSFTLNGRSGDITVSLDLQAIGNQNLQGRFTVNQNQTGTLLIESQTTCVFSDVEPAIDSLQRWAAQNTANQTSIVDQGVNLLISFFSDSETNNQTSNNNVQENDVVTDMDKAGKCRLLNKTSASIPEDISCDFSCECQTSMVCQESSVLGDFVGSLAPTIETIVSLGIPGVSLGKRTCEQPTL